RTALVCWLGLAAEAARAERPPLELALVEPREAREFAAELDAPPSREAPPAPVDDAERLEQASARGPAPEPGRPPPSIRHRFSDGPRNVARARGASLARAEALGIGGHAAAQKLLWNRPGPELLAAVPGKPPKNLLWPVVAGTWGRGFGFTRKIRTDLRH